MAYRSRETEGGRGSFRNTCFEVVASVVHETPHHSCLSFWGGGSRSWVGVRQGSRASGRREAATDTPVAQISRVECKGREAKESPCSSSALQTTLELSGLNQ